LIKELFVEGIIMPIIRSKECPGPGWRKLAVAYVINAITGRLVLPTPPDDFWIRL
jgi:hypothetical protein